MKKTIKREQRPNLFGALPSVRDLREAKKMLNGIIPGKGHMIQKTWLIMRLTVFFVLVFLLPVSASVYSQQTKISLKLNDATLEEVFRAIHEQSDFAFFYKTDQIPSDKKVSVDYRNTQVKDILNQVLQGTNLGFYVLDQDIVISPRKGQDEVQAQQPLEVKGKVTDVNGNPLPGVTVALKSSTTGTITGADGMYVLGNVPRDGTLVFSFVGMRSQEIPVGSNKVVDVRLEEETIGIEEVVAIGYGTVKKSDLTGAVGSVEGTQIADRQVTQISQALQGAMSGVMVTRGDNAPGAAATIRIRGITTIGDSNPLVIVDGVPVGSIDDVNPNDVESISVLKDAASASIYGSRAASGVILITTKRAKTGELYITYNAEFGIEKPTELSDYVGAQRYMQMVNELRWNDNKNIAGGEYPTYSKDIIDNYASLHAENPDQYPDTDWMGIILTDNASRQSHILSISGGSNTIRTKASLAYDETDGLYMGRNYKRLTARFNNDLKINDYLSASIDFYAKRAISENPSIDPIYYARISAPVYAAVWSNGLIAEGKTGANIYGQVKEGGFKNNWNNQVGGKIALDFTPVEGLKLSAVVAPELNYMKNKDFLKKVQYTDYDDPYRYITTLQWAKSTNLKESRGENYHVTTQFLANYIRDFNGHSFNIMAGYEDFYERRESMNGFSDEMELSNYPYLDLKNSNNLNVGGNEDENAYRSFFGRLMYNYDNKYLLQANLRYDGSSRFHKDYRWGSFPSFSAGWVLTEEPFLKGIPGLSYLKLRGSWGTLGNQKTGSYDSNGRWIPNYYPFQPTVAFSNTLFYQGGKIVSVQTAAQQRYSIHDITWESTETVDIGLDAYFMDSRLRVSGDIYNKKTKDMLLELEIPDYLGFDNPQQNTGRMTTNGWELEIGWQDKLGELTYGISANLSDSKSEMGDLGGIEFLGDQVKFKGSEFNEWYGYVSDGIYQTAEDVAGTPVMNANVSPGDIRYKDVSGPDGTPDGIISSTYDRVLLGGSLPRYIFGGNLRLEYKNVDFSMTFQGIGKQNVRKTSRMVRPLAENWGNFPALIDGNYWSVYHTEAQNLQAGYPRLSFNSDGNNYAMSDFWMFNGAYFRLKNITLGYTLPSRTTAKLRLKGVRIYGTMSDVFTINKYPKGWDPEVSENGYPITTSFICGVSVKF